MMCRTVLSILFFLTLTNALTQESDSLQLFQAERLNYQKKAMLALGTWSTINITTGAIGYATSTGESSYFHQMNAGWNLVNLGLALSGYFGAKKEEKQTFSYKDIFLKQQKTEYIFLFNSALNLTYITTGLLLMERAKNNQNNFHRFQGFGNSLIVQGSFLFAFDTFNFILHRKHGKRKLY